MELMALLVAGAVMFAVWVVIKDDDWDDFGPPPP